MTEKEKMLAGELYDCGDAELLALWHRAKDLARDYNLTNSSDTKRKSELLNELLGKVGNQLWITPPFHVDYGCNIYFGNNCEVNMNCTFLDDNKIFIGDNVLIAPNVQIYTAYHPTHYLDRFTISENETFNFCKTQNEIVSYGQLADISVTKMGVALIELPKKYDHDNYQIKVFSEQYNGDYKTDYASELVDLKIE